MGWVQHRGHFFLNILTVTAYQDAAVEAAEVLSESDLLEGPESSHVTCYYLVRAIVSYAKLLS